MALYSLERFAAEFCEIFRRGCHKLIYGDPFGDVFVKFGVDEGSGPSSHTLDPLGPLGPPEDRSAESGPPEDRSAEYSEKAR